MEWYTVILEILGGSAVSVALAIALFKIFIQHSFKESEDKYKHELDAHLQLNLQALNAESSKEIMLLQSKANEVKEKLKAKVNVVTPKQIETLENLYEALDNVAVYIERLTAVFKPGSSNDILSMMKDDSKKLADTLIKFTEIYRKGRIYISKELCLKLENYLMGGKFNYYLVTPALGSPWANTLIQQRAEQWSKNGESMKKLEDELTSEIRNQILV